MMICGSCQKLLFETRRSVDSGSNRRRKVVRCVSPTNLGVGELPTLSDDGNQKVAQLWEVFMAYQKCLEWL